MCKEGAVYCKNQLDRSADEANNAGDILCANDQVDIRHALERTDYESPYFMVQLLDQFCKLKGFDELSRQLSIQQDLERRIRPRDLIGVVKGISCVAPLIHKRCAAQELKGCHTGIMDIATQMVNSMLSAEEIRMFAEAAFVLSKIAGQIYTQRTKQEKMEQFLILLTQACFGQSEEKLSDLGEELVEKLCYFKEYPFRTQYQTYMWLNETIGNKPLFWKKLEDNFAYGFDYSCMTFLHLLGANAAAIETSLKKFDRKVILEAIRRMRDILPKNVLSLQVNMLSKILSFYKDDKEICETGIAVLWTFTDAVQGFTRGTIEEAKHTISMQNSCRKELMGFSLQDIFRLRSLPKGKYANIDRTLNYFHDILERRHMEDGRAFDKKFVKENVLTEECLGLVLSVSSPRRVTGNRTSSRITRHSDWRTGFRRRRSSGWSTAD